MNGNIRKRTKMIVVVGLMLAITIILTFTPLGFIQVPPISITIMHIPSIIAGIVAGPIAGAIVGLGMGLASFFRALTSANIADKLFINPLVSVLPRLFIGVAAYYAYSGVKKLLLKRQSTQKLRKGIPALVGSIAGTLTNTVLVLSMIYIVYYTDNPLVNFIGVAISVNVVVELIVAVMVCVPIAIILERQYNQS